METTPTSLDDLKGLLEENLEATKENTKILKAMRRDALISGAIKVLIWIILIGASLYLSAKFLEPYLGMLQGAQESGAAMPDVNALIEEYRSLIGQ